MKKPFNPFKQFSLNILWLWLGIFALLPILLMIGTSFLTPDPATIVLFKPTIKNYYQLLNQHYLRISVQSLYLATSCALICLVLGYPFAFIIARAKRKYQTLLLFFVIIPFWTSSLIRTYAIVALLKAKGIINSLLIASGITHAPSTILYTYTAVLIGCVYDLLPFMILPLYANIEKLNPEYIEAAQDLGAGKFTTFVKIIIPLTTPGIIAGILAVFLPSITMFYIPALLGGAKNILLGNLIEGQFLTANNWPVGAAINVVITFIMCVLIFFYWRSNKAKLDKDLV